MVVTTAGGIADDLIKCLAPTCKFEDWIIPIFDQMLREQNSEVFYFTLLYSVHYKTDMVHNLWIPGMTFIGSAKFCRIHLICLKNILFFFRFSFFNATVSVNDLFVYHRMTNLLCRRFVLSCH